MFTVLQVGSTRNGMGRYGTGATAELAIADAVENGIDANQILKLTGRARTSDHHGRKLMTTRGELADGDVVVVSDEELEYVV